MPTPKLTPALRADYLRLFQTCRVNPGALATVSTLASRIADNRACA